MNGSCNKINGNDLLMVVIYGLVFGLIGGFIGGLVDYVFEINFNISIQFGIYIETVFVGIFIGRAYRSYHVLYSILAIFFVYLSFLFADFVFDFVLLFDFGWPQNFEATLMMTYEEPSFYIHVFTDPIKIIRFVAEGYADSEFVFGAIINLLSTIISFILVFRLAKGKNK